MIEAGGKVLHIDPWSQANFDGLPKADLIVITDIHGDHMAAEPALSLKIACEYWKRRKLNADCDRDDIRATTRRINGGLNGLEDRSNYIRKAKEALARIEGIQLTGAVSDPRPVLRRGSTGVAVGDLQAMLSKLKFALAIDQDFGAATELAVMRSARS